MRKLLQSVATLALALAAGAAEFANGIPKDPEFFPLAVWVQSPKNAERFKAAGINTYVGLWHGRTEEHLTALKAAGMKVVCAQNEVGLAHKDDKAIIGWLQGDEPDNAQAQGEGKGWGPPILPAKVVERYNAMRAADATRPVVLNMGQGVAWDNYIGRGVRRNRPEDYPEYVKGGDIVSFDIYPATHDHPDIKGKLEYVAKGVERLKKWAGPDRTVWNCVEAKIGDGDARMTPHQLRAEVWMSLIHGSKGIIYFVHQFKPVFREASIFHDAELLKAFTAINHQITELAPALNGAEVEINVTAKSAEAPIAAIARQRGNEIYVFAVAMSERGGGGAFEIPSLRGKHDVEVLGEDRRILHIDTRFEDQFKGYKVHLYRLTQPAQ